jgi:hypothetical protein
MGKAMRRIVPGMMLALLLANVFLVALQVKTAKATGTLADSIALILNNVSFNTGWVGSVHYGVIFNRTPLNAYDSANGTDAAEALWIRRMAQIDGYTSATLDANAQNALQDMSMIGHIPITYVAHSCWLDYDRFVCEAFDWAQSWGISGWDKQACFNEVLAAYQNHGSPLLGYPSYAGSTRYYDEYAESLDIFNKLNGSDQGLWQAINNLHWSSSARLYGYTAGSSMYECEAGPFAFVIAYYRATHGNDIPNFDRVGTDLGTKFLANGWSSPAWGQPGIVQHAYGNPQLRLQNTFIAVAAMQLYYKNAPWQTEFVNMLNGTTYPPAWQGALSSALFSGNKFAMLSGQTGSDTASAVGLMMLFLEGIIPDTGSLAMPISEERYEDTLSFTPASNFNYDSNNHKIRIPVWAGTLKFQFGSQVASANFPSDGIYEVQFSSDWNTVTNVNQVSSLSPNFYYMETAPPAYDATVNAYCNEENNDVSVAISMDGVRNSLTPQTFTALEGIHTFTVPNTDQNGHPFRQWSTGKTSTSLTVSNGGNYTAYYQARYNLTLAMTTCGSTNPAPGAYACWSGTEVSITAFPNAGCAFDHWELDGANVGRANQTTVAMNSNHNLLALFGPAYSITVKAQCITEGADVDAGVSMDGSPTGYATPHIFIGLAGTHTFTVPSSDQNRDPFGLWSTGSNSTTITVSSAGTYTAYYKTPTPTVHDVAVADLRLSKTLVGQGYSLNLTVTVLNLGDYTETVNVTSYANTTEIETQETTLSSGNVTNLTFTWNTTGFFNGNYTISTYTEPVPDETDMADNNFTGSLAVVTNPGDVTGDTKASMNDIVMILDSFGSTTGPDGWYWHGPPCILCPHDPNCDIDGNGKVDIGDLIISLGNFGQHYP